MCLLPFRCLREIRSKLLLPLFLCWLLLCRQGRDKRWRLRQYWSNLHLNRFLQEWISVIYNFCMMLFCWWFRHEMDFLCVSLWGHHLHFPALAFDLLQTRPILLGNGGEKDRSASLHSTPNGNANIYILILKHVFNKKNQTRGYNYTYMMSYIKSTLAS